MRSNNTSKIKQDNAVFKAQGVKVYYSDFMALQEVNVEIPDKQIVAFIGPSGCGKSTFLRCFNRMNDLITGARVEGKINYQGKNIYDEQINPVKLRRQVGMVFQRPNPFPKSIYENIAFGPRANGYKGNMDQLVEQSLRKAALWEEVKDKLKEKGTALSGGQQQRLCIARAIAMKPEVLLMDEPCSALDPRSTAVIEQLIGELRRELAIVIVTHNLQQAYRVGDNVAFMYLGDLVEYGPTEQVFGAPRAQRTRDYVGGAFG